LVFNHDFQPQPDTRGAVLSSVVEEPFESYKDRWAVPYYPGD
jgi:hypothetical protein